MQDAQCKWTQINVHDGLMIQTALLIVRFFSIVCCKNVQY